MDAPNWPVQADPDRPPHGSGAAAYGGVMAWPPPLLEPLLGAAWRVAWGAAAGGLLLFAPLLYAVTGGRAPAGAPAWLEGALALFGVLLLALAAWRALRLTAAARSALAAGHGWLTVLEVAADRRGDTGPAIAGEREYRELPPDARTVLRVNRIASASLALFAGVLPPAGFLVLVLLAYGGAADADTAWMLLFGLLPAAGGLALASIALESLLLAGPRRRWSQDAAAALAPDVAAWAERFDAARQGGPGRGRTAGAIALRAGGAVALLAVAAVAAFALLFGALTIPAQVLADAATPRLDGVAARIAGVEAARPYRLPPDPTISARAAGEALHALVMAGHEDADPLLRRPVRVYRGLRTRPAASVPFSPPVPGPDWIHAAAAGLTPEQTTYLRDLSAHPALAELSTLARAASIDVIGTRYVTPFPGTLTHWELPTARVHAVRSAGEAMVARAALALDAGRAADAEAALREVVSAGVVLSDEAPFATDALFGATIAALGLASLEALYDVTGRDAAAAHVAQLSDAVRRATAAAGGNGKRRATGTTAGTAAAGALALEPSVPRALRWELAAAHVVVRECGSLRHRLFGESAEYREWKERAHAALARSPAEAALLDLIIQTPVRAEVTPRGALGRAAAFVARVLPGGPRCSAIWTML